MEDKSGFIEKMTKKEEEETNINQEVHHFSPEVLVIYNQMLSSTTEQSEFLGDLKNLVSRLKNFYNSKSLTLPHSLQQDCQKRLGDIQTLEAAISAAEISNEDIPLVVLCRNIIGKSDTRLSARIHGINSLQNDLKDLLVKYFTDDKLKINLISVKEGDFIERRNLELICAYHRLYLEMEKFKQRVDDDDNSSDESSLNEQYLRLCQKKNTVILELRGEMSRLKSERQALHQNIKRQETLIDIYLRQIQKLSSKLEELESNIASTLVKCKRLRDENTLLRKEVKANTKQLVNVLKDREQLMREKQKVSEENAELRARLSAMSRDLHDKTRELSEIKSKEGYQSNRLLFKQTKVDPYNTIVISNLKTTLFFSDQVEKKMAETQRKVNELIEKAAEKLDLPKRTNSTRLNLF